MCCIFTCCGWVIDLVQRLWTFTMACCISSAVCCAILTASMSGIALGYNYSLAEYIDLKETNVSVYLKRGVFDDEIADDMDWRRAGHMPVAGHLKEEDLITAPPDDEPMARSGRRMDDSVFESDDHHRFEGSLMKLTAKPVFDPTSTTMTVTGDDELEQIYEKFPKGSIEQLKAIQSVINRRKMDALQMTTSKYGPTNPTRPENLEKFLAHFPAFPAGVSGKSGRKMIEPGYATPPNSARLAVPDRFVGKSELWGAPRMVEKRPRQMYIEYGGDAPTFPTPATLRGPLRPSRRRPPPPPKPEPTTTPPTTVESVQKLINEDLNPPYRESDIFKGLGHEVDENILSRVREKMKKGEGSEDYEEDIKGLPVRRKRHVNSIPKLDSIFAVEDKHLEPQDNIIPVNQELEQTTASNYLSKIVEVCKNFNSLLSISDKVKPGIDSTTTTTSLSTNAKEVLPISPDILNKFAMNNKKEHLSSHPSSESTILASDNTKGIYRSDIEISTLFNGEPRSQNLLIKIIKSTVV